MVKAAVDQLVKEKQTVTIEAICRKSVEVDSEGRGVKKSAILENAEAHTYYQKHSTSYQTMKQRNRKPRGKLSHSSSRLLCIDPNRDVDRARYRYMHMTKVELVDRLLTIEQGYAEVHQQLARLQFELLEIQRLHMKKNSGTLDQHARTRERKPINGSTNNE